MAGRRSAARSSQTAPGAASGGASGDRIQGAPLEPVRRVRRELVSPSGKRVIVEVPVYPPFRLRSDAERKAASG